MKLNSHQIPDALKEVVIERLNEALSHLSRATLIAENLNDNAAYNEIIEADSIITTTRNVLQRCWFGRHSK